MSREITPSRYFKLVAEIDFCYWALSRLSEGHPTSPIAELVDNATGKSNADAIELKKSSIKLLERIVSKKRALKLDATADKEALRKVKDWVI